MGIEIERKFAVVNEQWRSEVLQSRRIWQGYLAEDEQGASVRVRMDGPTANINIKQRVIGPHRLEYEYEIPVVDAEQMLEQLVHGGVIEKTRHLVDVDGLTWEVDEFGGTNAGLVVAEIELSSVDQTFRRPPWVGRELTDDERYYNIYLAKSPYSQWGDVT